MSTHSDPLQATFDILSRHESEESGEVLLSALWSSDADCRSYAAGAAVRRRGHLDLERIIRRADSLDDNVCAEFCRNPTVFSTTLDHCLTNDDAANTIAAIKFVRRTQIVDRLPAVIELLEHADDDIRTEASLAVNVLSEALAMKTLTGEESLIPAIDLESAGRLQQRIVARLDTLLESFDDLENPRPVIESVLILGKSNDAEIRNVLEHRVETSRNLARTALIELQSRPIYELLCKHLGFPLPPKIAMEAVRSRSDLEFVCYLLDWLPKTRSRHLDASLSKIVDLPWLQLEHPTLFQIPSTLHEKLVLLIDRSGIDLNLKSKLKVWILGRSDAAGREAAGDILSSLETDEAERILHDALLSDDPKVEAWATRQLRAQNLPDAFAQLLQRLDADLPEVQTAAREELSGFDVEHVLDIFEQLPDSTCRGCGTILQKIHPDSLDQFRDELAHPYQWRRIRAARAVGELGLADSLIPALTALLEDPESTVRRAAIESIALGRSVESITTVAGFIDDDSRPVRDTARESLNRIRHELAGHPPAND